MGFTEGQGGGGFMSVHSCGVGICMNFRERERERGESCVCMGPVTELPHICWASFLGNITRASLLCTTPGMPWAVQ